MWYLMKKCLKQIKDYTEEEPKETLEDIQKELHDSLTSLGVEEKKEEIDITVPEELVDPVTKEIPKILKTIKEELTGESEKVIEEGASDKIDKETEASDALEIVDEIVPKDFKYSGTMEHPEKETE